MKFNITTDTPVATYGKGDEQRITFIKAIRAFTGLGLLEAKTLMEAVDQFVESHRKEVIPVYEPKIVGFNDGTSRLVALDDINVFMSDPLVSSGAYYAETKQYRYTWH